MTPAFLYAGKANRAIASEATLLAATRALHPERFVRGLPQPLKPAAEVWNNPPENPPHICTLELPGASNFVSQVPHSDCQVALTYTLGGLAASSRRLAAEERTATGAPIELFSYPLHTADRSQPSTQITTETMQPP